MAHIPLIHGPDGAKLSKRHGALGVDAYRAMGYLPAALRNYLVRLGWSHGDQEIFSTEEMIAAFDLPAIGRSPARFDFAKLENLNGHYIRRARTIDRWSTMFEDVLPLSAERRRARRRSSTTPRARSCCGDAGPEGARQDAGRADRRRLASLCRPAARARRQGSGAADAGGPRADRPKFCPTLETVEPWTRGERRRRRCAVIAEQQ